MQQPETTIRVDLCRRHWGRHDRIRSAEIPLLYESIVTVDDEGEVHVDEAALLRVFAALPGGFMHAEPNKVLLLVEDTAVSEPKLFRRWGKYFDSLSLFVHRSTGVEEQRS